MRLVPAHRYLQSVSVSYRVFCTLHRKVRTFVTSGHEFAGRNTLNVADLAESETNTSSEFEVTVSNQHEQIARALTPLWRVPYEEQLQKKYTWAEEVVKLLRTKLKKHCEERRIWKYCLPDVLPVQPSPVLEAYRNKDELNVRRGVDGNDKTVGFFIGSPSTEKCVVVSGKHVINMKPRHFAVAERFQEYVRLSDLPTCHSLSPGGGNWKGILIRSNEVGHVMAVVLLHPQSLPEERLDEEKNRVKEFFTVGPGADTELHSLYFQACKHLRCTQEQAPFDLLHGEPFIEEQLLELRFRISPDSFFQINTRAAEVLYRTVLQQAKLSPMTTLIDLCCGIGAVTLLASNKCRCCVGIDAVPAAIRDAKVNAKLNNITNVDFFSGRVEKKLLRTLHSLDLASDITAVINPGRAGVLPHVIQTLSDCPQLRRVVYVSCKADHPVPLHNFMQLCSQGGFQLKRVIPVDLFPHTLHTELVMVFTR